MVTWTNEQKKAIEQTGSDILVAAAAGSGKTAVLVERIIQKVVSGQNPINIDEILVATFTNAAAEEMRNRIGFALEEAVANNPTSYHLKKQLSLLQRASISTLHAFCTTVVRQYAYLLDLDPAFRIGDEMEMELLKTEVLDDMLEDYYGMEEEQLQMFYSVVDMFSSDRNDVDVAQLILKLYTFAMQNPWPDSWLQRVAATYYVEEDIKEEDIEWLHFLKNEVMEQLLSFRTDIERAIQIARESDGPYHYLEALESDIQQINEAINRTDSWDDLQEYITASKLKSLSSKRVECNEDKKEAIKAIRTPFRNQWNKWKKSWFSRNLTAHLEDMRKLYPAIHMLTNIVTDFKSRFASVKREQALVDFSDLEHFCLQILISEDSTEKQVIPSEIAHYYQKQFHEILVDEYQDINIVQETILSVVSDQTGVGNMFMVGDVKQSIYRFRHAEPTLFINKYKHFAMNPSAGYRIDLARNFRSREEVLTGANYLFRQIFDEALGEIDYDEQAELIYGNKEYDEVPLDESDIEMLIIDREIADDEQEEDGENVEHVEKIQLEARLYADKINTWIGKKEAEPMQVIDKVTKQKRHIQFRDIVILQRSLTGAPTIVEELKKQGIPVHAELRTGYFVAIEIQVMINILKIIDNPYQDIPLASVLRSPMVGLDEEQLAQIRLADQRAPYYVALQKYVKQNNNHTSSLMQEFLANLSQFRESAKEGALSTLIWEIFRETGYYDFVGGIPGGKQRQANLRALYDRARGYESTSFRGLFRFLRFIENMQEQEKDLGEARALSDQEDVVRIMTIHKSKGLEFPVVLLGGMTKEFNFRDIRSKYILDKDLGFATKFIDPVKRITYPTLYYISLQQAALQKLLAEEMRVLYVAMTRAKEKLVMIGNVPSFKKELEKWLPILNHDQWILPKQRRKDAKSYIDWVGPALIRHHHNQHMRQTNETSMVPSHIEQDPSKWKVERVSAASLLHVNTEELQSSDDMNKIISLWEGVPDVEESPKQMVEERLSFHYAFTEATQTGAKQSVTEIKRRQEVIEEQSGEQLTRPFRAPLVKQPTFMQSTKDLTAAEIGTAMHTVMQHIPLTKKWQREEIATFISQFVQEEKLTRKEAEVIQVDAIERFFDHHIAEKMMNAKRVEREIPFTYSLQASDVYKDWQSPTDEKVLIQGVADCIIHTEDGIIILDYKTDAIDEQAPIDKTKKKLIERYRVQIDLYETALANILQTNVLASYLYFFTKDLLIKM